MKNGKVLKSGFWVFVVFTFLFLTSCASQRTRATCAETEYRLNAMNYSPDQRIFLEEELRQCRALQKEQEKEDVLTNKVKDSIYEQFKASEQKETSADSLGQVLDNSTIDSVNVQPVENEVATDSLKQTELLNVERGFRE